MARWWVAALGAAGSMMMPNGGGDAAPAGARSTAATSAGRFVDGAFTSDVGTRRWRLWVPSGYEPARRYALVVMLHGCTQDPDDLARGTRVTEHADRRQLLVLIPEQPATANVKKCWNWYDPANQRRDAGEPALIAGMTRQVASEWSVDAQRVYLAGISAGAAMASVVAVAYPDVYAAVGLHSGIPYGAATNVMEGVSAMTNGAADTRRLAQVAHDAMGARARPIPVIIVQGAADPVVRPINAVHTRDLWVAMNALARGSGSAASDTAAYRRVETQVGGLDAVTECHGPRIADGACEVVTLTVAGLGHAWSGGSKLGTFTDERGPDATDEIVRFLLSHQMPARGTAPNARQP